MRTGLTVKLPQKTNKQQEYAGEIPQILCALSHRLQGAEGHNSYTRAFPELGKPPGHRSTSRFLPREDLSVPSKSLPSAIWISK